MTEENLPDEELEDFDSLLSDAQDAGMDDDAGLGGGDLDDIFGQEGGGDDPFAADDSDAGGGGDSDLDSFFEDLSTIDDLEVLQEDEEPSDESEPSMDEEVGAPEPPVDAEEAAPAPVKEKPKKAPREKKPRGPLFKMIKWLVLLGIFAGGGYYAYMFFFPEYPMPWDVIEGEKDKLVSVFEERLAKPPPPEPLKLAPPPPVQPRPAPVRKPEPPKEQGPWSVQVASCFFPSCLEGYSSFLKSTGRSVVVRGRTARSETLEIRSIATLGDLEPAQRLAERINSNHPLEGHAYAVKVQGGYRISMGAFADLSRAKVVKEALNEQFFGEIAFSTQLKTFPYQMKSVMTGRYPSRSAANKALAQLRDKEPRFKDAFVARNR